MTDEDGTGDIGPVMALLISGALVLAFIPWAIAIGLHKLVKWVRG